MRKNSPRSVSAVLGGSRLLDRSPFYHCQRDDRLWCLHWYHAVHHGQDGMGCVLARVACLVNILHSPLIGLRDDTAGNLISFVPLTVEAAFLAGVGWKITKTGISFLLDKTMLFDGEFRQFGCDVLYNAMPMLVMGVFVMWAEARFHHSKYGQWTLPALLVGLTAIFYGCIFMLMRDHSWEDIMADARSPGSANHSGAFPILPDGRGWLMDQGNQGFKSEPFPQFFPLWNPPKHAHGHELAENTSTNWRNSTVQVGDNTASGRLSTVSAFAYEKITFRAIFNLTQLVNMLILVVVTVLAILLNSSAIEEETGSNIDFNRELKVTGIGNIFSAGMGGPLGYSSVGKTMLCHSMGGHYFAGLVSCAYYAGYMAFGFYFFRFIPLPVLGAFIFSIGMELLLEWIVLYRKKVTRLEYNETLFLFFVMTLNFVVGFFGASLSPQSLF